MPSSSRNRTILTKLLGPIAGLIHGDFFTLDRWLWLKPRLPRTANDETLLDVGCGTGAFTICAALRGYRALGLTWDESDMKIAFERAALCRASGASFRICDVRWLDKQEDLREKFDFVICCENIEHILDDRRLVKAIYTCLKPGGRLLLTTPNYHYRPITRGDIGPFRTVEVGSHVRRGYSEGQLHDLFADMGFFIEHITYCGGFTTQKLTGFLRLFQGRWAVVGWALSLPVRPLVPVVDWILKRVIDYPPYSICVEAYKTRWSKPQQT